MKTTIVCIATAALSLTFSGSAAAQCGSSAASRQALMLGPSALFAPELEAHAASVIGHQEGEDRTIVGLWDVKFFSNNQLYDEGFDQYHSDGTEIMVDIPPPATGNVCLGVWVKTGSQSYKLNHPFWIFDANGNLIGRGVLLQQFTLNAKGNAYAGTFVFRFRDLSGNVIPSMPDVSGSLSAQRITVD